MWSQLKDYFSFSRKDLRGIYVLLSILFILLLVRTISPVFIAKPEPDFTEFDRMVLALEKAQRLSLEAERAEAQVRQLDFNRPDREIAEIKLNPFPFDPNTMNEDAWRRLGLNMRQIRNIQNFKASGGSFRKTEDFKRIYTISDEEFEILKPYINIAQDTKEPAVTAPIDQPEKKEIPASTSTAQTRLIDINRADSLELLQLRGIGPSFARRIIRYRDLLGGFHSTEQLLEVYGLDSTRLEQFYSNLIFDRNSLRTIDVNTAEIKDLTSHPYIDFYLAKSIIDERIKKGRYNSDADLYGIPLLHDALYQKIIPYFSFNSRQDE
jgi:competence protein ComEA